MKFKVCYLKPKKKGYAKQEAVFFDERDAAHWERHVESLGCTKIETYPVFVNE